MYRIYQSLKLESGYQRKFTMLQALNEHQVRLDVTVGQAGTKPAYILDKVPI